MKMINIEIKRNKKWCPLDLTVLQMIRIIKFMIEFQQKKKKTKKKSKRKYENKCD